MDALFRDAHTIKGAASMLGLDDIRTLAHAAEDVLALVRGTGAFPRELAAPLLRATVALRAMVRGSAGPGGPAEPGGTTEPPPLGDLLRELAACRAALPGGGAVPAGEGAVPAPERPAPEPPAAGASVPPPRGPAAPAARAAPGARCGCRPRRSTT